MQAVLAGAMAGVVLDRSAVIVLGWPDWAYYATLVLCALSVVANAVTPSTPERRLGLPIAGLMLATAGLAAWI